MKREKEHIEAVESYINGNISDFREYINSLKRVEFLDLLDVCKDYGITKKQIKKVVFYFMRGS